MFINKSFDALNLTQPELVAEVHQEYVRAGADIIETNTFGANRIKLGVVRPGRQAARHQRRRARRSRGARRGDRAYVAGAIGPLGIRIEPWGKTGVDEAREYFREQAQALADGGVDLFILETFRDLNEIGAAIDAVRSVSDLPIVAQMTTEEDGNTLDGTPPERFAPELEKRGATIIGVNCAVGPAPMLETIERMEAVTHAEAVGAAQRRQAARRRGAQHLSLLARVHGVVRAPLHPAQRARRRRLLRDDAGAHPADQGRRPRRARPQADAPQRRGNARRASRRRRSSAPPVPREQKSRLAQRAGARHVRDRRRAAAAARLRVRAGDPARARAQDAAASTSSTSRTGCGPARA